MLQTHRQRRLNTALMNQPANFPEFKARPAWWGTGPFDLLAEVQELFRESSDPMDELPFWQRLMPQVSDLSDMERADVEFYIVKSITEADAPAIGEDPITEDQRKVWSLLEAQFDWKQSEAWLKELISQNDNGDEEGAYQRMMASLATIEVKPKSKAAPVPSRSTSHSGQARRAAQKAPEPETRIEKFWAAKAEAKKEAERRAQEKQGASNGLILTGIVVFVGAVAAFFAWTAGLLG